MPDAQFVAKPQHEGTDDSGAAWNVSYTDTNEQRHVRGYRPGVLWREVWWRRQEASVQEHIVLQSHRTAPSLPALLTWTTQLNSMYISKSYIYVVHNV